MNDTIEKPKTKKKETLTIEQRIKDLIKTKPSDQIKIINVFDSNYRVNVYSFEQVRDLLFKRASISASYFIIAKDDGTLVIDE